MFSLGNWVDLAALGSLGGEPFLEKLVTDRDVLHCTLSTVGKI